MFDLFRRRDKVMRYVLTGMLSLIAISLVVTLIPGFMDGSSAAIEDQTLGSVGGEVISVVEAQRRIDGQVRQGLIPKDNPFLYVNNVIQDLIGQKAAQYEAKRMGFTATDEEVRDEIKMAIPNLFPNGQFVGPAAYEATLAQANMSVPQFEGNIRRNVMLRKISGLVSAGVFVTPAEIEADFNARNEKLKFEYISIDPKSLEAAQTVTPEEIRKEYETTRAGFTTPEKRNAAVIIMDENIAAAGLTASDTDLRRLYDSNRDSYRLPERVKARHILVKTTEKPEPEVKRLKAKAEDLLAKVKAGGDFADLAKKNSDDTVSAANGGDLGYLVRGQTVKPFEDAAFTLKPNQISNLVTTEYGFHIIQVQEKEEPKLRSFEEVRGELVAQTQREQVFDRMQKSMEDIRAEALKNPKDYEAIARKYNAIVVPAAGIASPDHPFPQLGPSQELAQQLLQAPPNGVTSLVQTANNKLAIGVLTGTTPPGIRSFEEVQAEVKSRIVQRKSGEATRNLVKEVQDALKANGGDMKAVAAKYKLKTAAPEPIRRSDSSMGLGSGSAMLGAFNQPPGTITGPYVLDNKGIIVKTVAMVPADPSTLAAEKEMIVGVIRQRKERQRAELFLDGLINRLTKDGKLKVNDEAIKKLVQQYSSASAS